ncbi:MAG TPA: transcription elongation factor GreA [Myxococcota bacterium]|nr:transcription elongation factor GreA [Myxococcota bacterium]
MKRVPVTPEGYIALQDDLRYHREVLRPQIVRDIEEARAQGDISENSEYEDAKERQSHCEGRIEWLESTIASAEIIDVTKVPRDGRVVFGTTVVLADPDTGDEKRWRIVGETESDVARGWISYTAPLGRAMIGHREGDEVTVPTPAGPRRWEVVGVLYLPPEPAASVKSA